jgi:hypothetical protein
MVNGTQHLVLMKLYHCSLMSVLNKHVLKGLCNNLRNMFANLLEALMSTVKTLLVGKLNTQAAES